MCSTVQYTFCWCGDLTIIMVYICFYLRFTGNVKLKGVIVIGGNEESHPSEMKL